MGCIDEFIAVYLYIYIHVNVYRCVHFKNLDHIFVVYEPISSIRKTLLDEVR